MSHLNFYHKYVEAMQNEFNLNYSQLESIYMNFSDAVGVYPDVSYLMYKMMSHPLINEVVEIGAGMSTTVFSHAAMQLKKNFTSIESDARWSEIVKKALLAANIDCPNLISTENLATPPILSNQIDLMFVDGPALNNNQAVLDRIDSSLHYKNLLKNAVVAFDDSQWYKEEVARWNKVINNLSDREDTVYNPQGRLDRHIYISIPKSKKDIISLINNCNKIAE